MMQKKFTLYNFETFRSRDHGSVPVMTGAACDVITGTFPIGGFWHLTKLLLFSAQLLTAITREPFV